MREEEKHLYLCQVWNDVTCCLGSSFWFHGDSNYGIFDTVMTVCQGLTSVIQRTFRKWLKADTSLIVFLNTTKHYFDNLFSNSSVQFILHCKSPCYPPDPDLNMSLFTHLDTQPQTQYLY